VCGIAGTVALAPAAARTAVERMCAQMIRRGPDDGGIERLAGGAVLGSRRLAIIDPTPAGHQPMRDAERGTTVVFNGMIYNFRELRSQLEAEGEQFVSECDTEVVLRAYGRWGRGAVQRLHGMFALAIWDERDRTLLLARDRLGIKPLYYANGEGRLAFASTVKALLAAGIVPAAVSRPGLASFLAFGAVAEPLTAIEGIHALPPASTAAFRDGRLSLERYWEPPAVAQGGMHGHEDVLRTLLANAVRTHLVSDVPLGVFLSGGLDSSLVAALAAREVADVRTVSVAFEDRAYDEAAWMDRVAHRIGSTHTTFLLRPSELVDWLDDAFDAMDQPTLDGINTYVVSRVAAAGGLKVALSGLGADELFDGYRHVRRVRLLGLAEQVPSPLRRATASLATLVPHGARGDKAVEWLRDPGLSSPYELLRRLFLPRDIQTLLGGNGAVNGATPRTTALPQELYARVSRLDLENYLRNVLLRDTDSMSMGNSLEVRVPYLDDAVVSWTLAQPAAVKGEGKAILGLAASGLVPEGIVRRRKRGFVLPLSGWMRNELHGEVSERLSQLPAALDGALAADAIGDVWSAYCADGRRWLRPWSLYALSRWLDTLPKAVAA